MTDPALDVENTALRDRAGRSHLAPRRWSFVGELVAQFVFIAAGVFLGMQADDWKQARERKAALRATLQNFRDEMVANRKAVVDRKDYHRAMIDSMMTSQRRGDPPPKSVREVMGRIGWRGLRPVSYGHVAWDLALATQSLSYVPQPLAFSIAKIYTGQTRIEAMQITASQQLFSPMALEDSRWQPFALSLMAYLEDMTIAEPSIIRSYDTLVPRIDSALARLK